MAIEIIENIIRIVLGKIKPDEHEKIKLYKVFMFMKDNLSKCLNESFGSNYVEITLQGSVAKDTFLKSQSDIDVFLLFPPEKQITIEWFKHQLIPIIINCFNNYKYTLNYASHPYVTLHVDDVDVNIVPAYKVPSPDKIISAVDRTPFHTEYVKSHLNEKQKDEVRVLKQFLRTWNLYGAEIEVQGFSGYLTELLIIAYGNFYNLLVNALNWYAYKTCIDIEHHYSSIKECLNKFRGDVLIVVDPVDPKRNVAAAVSLKRFSMFKLIIKMFLEKPSIEFFFEESGYGIDMKTAASYIENRLKNYDSCLYVLIFEITKYIPDTIWGQLQRLRNSLLNTLRTQTNDRNIYADIWIDRKNFKKAILVIELMHCNKGFKLHTGPYAFDVINAMNFLLKNMISDVGPWIDDDGRFYVLKPINRETISKVIIDIIKSVSFTNITFKDLIVMTSTSDLHSIKQKYSIDDEFIYWLRQFLERKPFKKIYTTFKT